MTEPKTSPDGYLATRQLLTDMILSVNPEVTREQLDQGCLAVLIGGLIEHGYDITLLVSPPRAGVERGSITAAVVQ